MRSKPESSSGSSPLRRFKPREDDKETLWEVIDITAERGRLYKVRWKGTNPETMKPWAQSWVKKEDCTDDLVQTWRKMKKEKERKRKCACFDEF